MDVTRTRKICHAYKYACIFIDVAFIQSTVHLRYREWRLPEARS